MQTLQNLYDANVSSGKIEEDAAQSAAIARFSALSTALEASPVVLSASHNKILTWSYESGESAPKGLYLFGDVGRGKSMVMDLFFQTTPITPKRRVHFHAFMEELHERMHHVSTKGGVDPLLQVASDIAKDARLLCFDEFYITNIADAMMLGRFFEMLYACGVTTCATSNWSLEDLFQDGFNRVRFKPFIGILKKNMEEVEVSSARDFRRSKHALKNTFINDHEGFKKSWENVSKTSKTSNNHHVSPKMLTICNTDIEVERSSPPHAVYFTFQELCEKPYGREHYMEIAAQFDSVFMAGLYALKADQADTAMRFIVLIDILYETGTKCTISSQVPLEDVCVDGDSAFAYKRTISRLHEMSKW